MKGAVKIYKGIEFVLVEELSAQQQLALKNNTAVERIKILIDGQIVSNCIQYQHYVSWYAATFEDSILTSTSKITAPQQEVVTVATH
jgi:hypothetical protein